jgi:multidrug resistance protein, MATE family
MSIQDKSARHLPAGPRGRRLAQAHARRQTREAGEIGRLAAPIMVAGGLNVAISLTDTAMMAALDPQALAGGAVVSDIYSIAFYFATGILAAVTPLSAAAIGAGEPRRVGAIVAHAAILLAILAVAGHVIVSRSVDLLTGAGVAIPQADAAAEYAGYMGFAFAFMLVFALGRSTLAALGRGRAPLVILAIAVPLNALGNHVLMHGAFGAPRMGLAGAGAASLIVAIFAASATIGHALMSRELRRYRPGRGLPRYEHGLLLRIAGTGLMIAVATVAETGIFLVSTLIVAVVATDMLAAHALVFRSLGLSYSVIVGLGQAVTVRVALARGAANARQECLVRRTADLIAAGLSMAYLAGFCLLGPTLALHWADGAEPARMIAQAAALMPFAGFALVALTLGATSTAILRGQADVSVPAALTLAGYWLVGLTTILVATQLAERGAEGVWIGLITGSLAAAAASRGYRWWRENGGGTAQRKLAAAAARA